MADDHQRRATAFGGFNQCRSAAADLADATRLAVDVLAGHELDRIDHDQAVFARHHRSGKGPCVTRGYQPQEPVRDPHAMAAIAHLRGGFLSGGIQHRMLTADSTGDLRQQGAFSDTRFATDQHRRAHRQASAQNAIQFGHAGRKARRLRRADGIQRLAVQSRSSANVRA